MNKPIIEVFQSIQGEGKFIGTLSTFVRFSGCNLACSFCDTKFSWNEEGKYSTRDVIDFINKSKLEHVIFTGGEPGLHQNEIVEIISNIQYRPFVTIETNGTIKPIKELEILMHDFGFWSVSPKNDKCLLNIFNAYPQVQFKFVIENVNEIEKVHELDNKIYPIFIQPNGFREDYSNACKELAEYIIEKGYQKIRVLPQFHRIMWGQKRGI